MLALLIFGLGQSKTVQTDTQRWLLGLPTSKDHIQVGILVNEASKQVPTEYSNLIIDFYDYLKKYNVEIGVVVLISNL
jgi:hypothetical protein